MIPSYGEWCKLRSSDPPRDGELILDEIFPFAAFADLIPPPCDWSVTAEEVLESWSRRQNFVVGEGAVIGRGVRDLLWASWSVLQGRVGTAWIPADVYPVYEDLVGGDEARTFETLPSLDLTFLDRTGSSDLVLLPAPLHPAGRFLAPDEIVRLRDLLIAEESRFLIIDAVYGYRERLAVDLAVFAEIDRCIVLRSMSKAWLCRQQFGVAEFPDPIAAEVRRLATPPIERGLQLCAAALESDVLGQQRTKLVEAWSKLEAICQPPSNGYLTLLEGGWEKWREEGLRVVPASVFGSAREDVSVVSCLGLV